MYKEDIILFLVIILMAMVTLLYVRYKTRKERIMLSMLKDIAKIEVAKFISILFKDKGDKSKLINKIFEND